MAHSARQTHAPELRAAAILDDGSTDVDGLLAHIAQGQRLAGRRVRGMVMTYPDGADGGGDDGCAAAMVLRDVDTNDEYLVSQALGSGSRGCRADPQGFARASAVLRRALDESPDLVVVNRFGGLEAEGGGFCAELLDLLVRDVPLLTVVSQRHVDAWQRFTGGAEVLPAREQSVGEWLSRSLAGSAG